MGTAGKLISSLLLLLLAQVNASAINYYLSQKGDDSNSGTTKESPWRSLKKLNKFLLTAQSNDSIFFERGGIFPGELEIFNSNIYLGAYGVGVMPVISGSTTLRGWTRFRNNVWKTECRNCSEEISNFFIDGKAQPLGRYPNADYLSVSDYSASTNSILDNSSKFADGQWNDSEMVVRSSRWTIDNLGVTEYKNKTFYINEKPSYPLQSGVGYFLQKNIATLDL